MSSSTEIVRVDAVTKDVRPGFGLRTKRVLHEVSFCVREGEIFGFVGPNGAGKTTMLKVLMGLIRPTSGSARVLGHDVAETAFRRHVGFLPENPYFYDYLTGRETVDFYAKLCGLSRERRRARADELLAQVGLAHAAGARIRTYSKGMQQRLGIAQALVHDPDVVFLDEPMSGLDPIGRKDVRDLILRLRDRGKTVFMNTHILHDVELVCDRVAIIAGGRIRYEGAIDDFALAGERCTDLLITSAPAHVGAVLEERFAAQLHGMGDRIEVRVPEKHVDDALALLLEGGARVLSVAPNRASLEQIFMSAVEESRR
ncbi:MAG TPA: ABC transporter ATP-binding protein [Myxococcota bacterium]|nr:ABC transporter ATP-binding protein [Myxococcota bacterium]